MNGLNQARISAVNAKALAKAFDIEAFDKKVLLTKQYHAYPIGTSSYLVKAYATRKQHNYFLLYSDKVEGAALMKEHCKGDDFCFRTLNFEVSRETD